MNLGVGFPVPNVYQAVQCADCDMISIRRKGQVIYLLLSYVRGCRQSTNQVYAITSPGVKNEIGCNSSAVLTTGRVSDDS